jgi:hypothetical protein
VTPLPTRARVGRSPPRRYWSVTNAGGWADPAATPSRPPNRSRRIIGSSQTATARPAASPTWRQRRASSGGAFSEGGVLTRSRARLIASPTISGPGDRLGDRPAAGRAGGAGDHDQRAERVPIGLGLAQAGAAGADDDPLGQGRGDLRRSPPSGTTTAMASLGWPARRLPTATPALKAAPASNAAPGPARRGAPRRPPGRSRRARGSSRPGSRAGPSSPGAGRGGRPGVFPRPRRAARPGRRRGRSRSNGRRRMRRDRLVVRTCMGSRLGGGRTGQDPGARLSSQPSRGAPSRLVARGGGRLQSAPACLRRRGGAHRSDRSGPRSTKPGASSRQPRGTTARGPEGGIPGGSAGRGREAQE